MLITIGASSFSTTFALLLRKPELINRGLLNDIELLLRLACGSTYQILD